MNPKTLFKKLISAFMGGVLLTGMLTITTSVAATTKVGDLSNTARSLHAGTYESLVGRITGRGYTETSLTGAYSGMYLRDSAIQIMGHNLYGDYHLSREMLSFIIGQHQDLGLEYTQHILGTLNETTYNYDNTYLTASAKTAGAISVCADTAALAEEDGSETYLGCGDIGMGHWNLQSDYIWAPFTPNQNQVSSINAYVNINPGVGTFTIGVYTDTRGKGELLGAAVMECDNGTQQTGWQTLNFNTPVEVTPGQTYYLRFESNDVKVILYGLDSPVPNDPHSEWVDAGRTGGGWCNNRLVNFLIQGGDSIDSYLGCTDVGSIQWNILADYVYGAFVPDKATINEVNAYVTVNAGSGTLTAGIYTDVYGHGELLGEATIHCDYAVDTAGWQTLTFDTPVRVTPGSTYYLRLGSDDVKVVLWGKETDGTNDKRAYVDAGRTGGGWRTDYLPNFEIIGAALDGNAALLELDSDTAGAQIIPALYGKKISSVRVILGREENATGILKATLSKGYGKDAVRVDWYEMDISEISTQGKWVKLHFSLPINKVDANQDYSLKLELVNSTGKVYWYGTEQLDQYGTYAINGDTSTVVSGEASFEAYTTNGASMWSNEIQPDGNYMFVHAWYQYATGCIDNEDNRIFIDESYPVIQTYANYYLDNGYIGENGLIRNPYFEHSREGRKWNAYDLITNVFASQALYEMSSFAADRGDTASADKWMAASLSLKVAIEEHLIVEYDGVDIYAELYDVDHNVFIPGISWVNLAPIAAEWYGIDLDVMQNTLDLYGVYATDIFYGYEMLYSTGDLGTITGGNSVIGKGLSWEIMYYHSIGNEKRRDYLLDFIESVAKELGCYGESYYKSRISDPGNQEHAGWQFYAVSTVYPELTKNYSADMLQGLVNKANAVEIDRLREESLGAPLTLVYALRDEAQALLLNERSTKEELDTLCAELEYALGNLSYIDEPPHTRLFHTGGETSKMEMTDDELGLAFRFQLKVDGAAISDKTLFDSTNATVDVAQNSIPYQLVKMGAVVTNKMVVGEDASAFTLESVNGGNVVDVTCVHLYSLQDNVAAYSVRVTNIPRGHEQTLIYARPYYVYLFNGEEIVVYGDIYSQSYEPKDSNDVTMDW